MLKLTVAILCLFTVAVGVLQLRQQRLNLGYQTVELHRRLEDKQAILWNQQLQIAMFTAPNAIARTVGDHELKMLPRSPLRADQADWMDVLRDPDAE